MMLLRSLYRIYVTKERRVPFDEEIWLCKRSLRRLEKKRDAMSAKIRRLRKACKDYSQELYEEEFLSQKIERLSVWIEELKCRLRKSSTK